MKLPIIKHLVQHEGFDEDYFEETIEVLLAVADARGVTDEEIEVIGEMLSNLEGAIEVKKSIKEGTNQKEALNSFMKRVLSSIDN